MSSSSLRSSSKESRTMEGVSICAFNLLRLVSAVLPLPSTYVVPVFEELSTQWQAMVVFLPHAGDLSSSLALVLRLSCQLYLQLHFCSVVNNWLFSAIMRWCQIQILHILLPNTNSLIVVRASDDCTATCWRSSNCRCAFQMEPVPCITRFRKSVFQNIQVEVQETLQMYSPVEACHIMTLNALVQRLNLVCISGLNLPVLYCDASDDSNEQDATELLKVLDATMQQSYGPLMNCAVYSWTPNTRVWISQRPTSFLMVTPSGRLIRQIECVQCDDGKESSGTKSPLWGSGFSWSWCKHLHVLRNLNSTNALPSGIRFKLAFLIFLLISSLLTSIAIIKPKNHRKDTTVFLVLFCLLQLSETRPSVYNPPLPHTSVNLSVNLRQTRETTNGTLKVPLKGSPNTGYCAMIGIGSINIQEFCVLIDTGSANLAVAGKSHPDINSWFHPDQNSASYRDLGKTVTVSYTAGTWTGRLSKDLISIGASDPVDSFLVVIESADGFYIKNADWVGIMGLAYSNLAKPDSSVTPFWEAFRAATGKADIFSLRFCPPLDIPLLDITEPKGGDMVLGGIDENLYEGPVFYTSLVQQRFYNVLVTNMKVGDTVVTLDCSEFNNDQSIVDSGTTDVFLPETVFAEVKKAFIDNFKDDLPFHVPEEFWIGGYKLAWPVDDKHSIYSAFPTFYLSFATDNNASQEFSLAVTPQIYLRQIEGTSEEQANTNCFPECDFFTFGIKQRQQGTVIGGNIMLGFYSIFDRENKRIGFARSTCDYQDDMGGVPYILGPYMREPINCECAGCSPGESYWEITTYVCGGLVIPLAIISVTIALCRRIKRSRCRERYWKLKCCIRKAPTAETGEGEQAALSETEGACGTGPATDGQQEQAQLLQDTDENENNTEGESVVHTCSDEHEEPDLTLHPIAKSEETQPFISDSRQPAQTAVLETEPAGGEISENENYNAMGDTQTEDMPLLSSSDSGIEVKDTDSHSSLHYTSQVLVHSVSQTVRTEAPTRSFESQRTHFLPRECRHAVLMDRQVSGPHQAEKDDFIRQASCGSQICAETD